jgi:hypothetical protein
MRSVRTLVRTLIAGFLALAGPVLAASGVPAHAQVTRQSARTAAAVSHSLTIAIDNVTPSFAQPGSTIRVSGTLSNDTGSTLQGIEVQLQSSPQRFGSRSAMDGFTADGSGFSPVNEGTPVAVTATLRNGGTVRWTASFTAASAQYGQFGVYPLAAQAVSSASSQQLAADRTLLPFWPGKGSAQPLNIAWIWPLIDVPQQELPQQGNCGQTLASASLATSLGTPGRLGTLLSTGLRWAGTTDLTWAVDPALLSDATVMTQPYKVGGNSACVGTTRMPASAAASGWLATLRRGTADEPMFLTPYADADVAALSHAGLDTDLRTAYTVGESVASQVLARPFGTNGTGTGDGGSASVAWPAGGTADASVLTSLASSAGVSTVVLNSNEMPELASSSSYPADTAVAQVTTGISTTMHVLLADSQLTSVLGSTTANAPAGAQFATEQEFLAQTAMIAAELPNSSRSVVVAPPRRWDPSAAEANALLSLTSQAPWLNPAPLSSLASSPGTTVSRQALPATRISPAELSGGYLSGVKSVDESMAVYRDLLYQPDANVLRSLDEVIAVTESAAWRGSGMANGRLALAKLSAYLQDSERGVQIITGSRKVLLAGTSGDTPVSVQNALDVPVQVKVTAQLPAGSQLTVGNFTSLITVPAQQTGTVRMPLRSSSLGTSMMQLQLQTKDGSPLTWTSQSLSIQVTRYGRAMLVLIAAALGVLVLTSAARWIRRWMHDGGAHARSGGTG